MLNRMHTSRQKARIQQLKDELAGVMNRLEEYGLSPVTDSSQAIELRDGFTLMYGGSPTEEPGEWRWVDERNGEL